MLRQYLVALLLAMLGASCFSLRSSISTARYCRSLANALSSQTKKLRILSGVQPTGCLHLGNYIGALKQWQNLQQSGHENFFCVVDMHAITVSHDPVKLKTDTADAAAMYIACGIDPSQSKIFIQSEVKAHAELCWYLSCITPMGWLERMIQFKEKSARNGENVCLGLFSYPVLMAADILLYQTNLVPVGEDQKQHIELTRDIYKRFNDLFLKKQKNPNLVFVEPHPLIVKDGARIMSLLDGRSKMSKSAENDNSRINLLDSPELILKKFKRCKTDSHVGLEFDNPERPECTNLLNIYMAVTGMSKEDVLREVNGQTWGTFKPLLADAVIAHLNPIRLKYNELKNDPGYLQSVLNQGRLDATEVAENTMSKVRKYMGF